MRFKRLMRSSPTTLGVLAVLLGLTSVALTSQQTGPQLAARHAGEKSRLVASGPVEVIQHKPADPPKAAAISPDGPFAIYPDKGGLTTPPGPEWTEGNNLLYVHGATAGINITRFTVEGALFSHAVQLETGCHLYIVGLKYGFVRVRQYDAAGKQTALYLIAYDAPRIGGPPKAAEAEATQAARLKLLTAADRKELAEFGTAEQKKLFGVK